MDVSKNISAPSSGHKDKNE